MKGCMYIGRAGETIFIRADQVKFNQLCSSLFVLEVPEIDQIFTVLLRMSMLVGGMAAFLLDNIVPGSNEDRGILKWRGLMMEQRQGTTASNHVYDLPFGITNKWKFAKYLPFMPYYPAECVVSSNGIHVTEVCELTAAQKVGNDSLMRSGNEQQAYL